MREIKRIFIHCTATSQKTTIESLKRGFINRGWKYPGYHYVITPNGDTVKLLDIGKPSNGVAGYNSTAINIAYIGGIDKDGKPVDNRTIEEKAALVHLLLQLREMFPKAKIMGHRDIWSTTDSRKWHKACPCFNATNEYGAI